MKIRVGENVKKKRVGNLASETIVTSKNVTG